MILACAAGLLTLATAGCTPPSSAPDSAATPPPATPPMGGGASSSMSGGGMGGSAGGAAEAPGDAPAEKKFTELEAKLAKSPSDTKLKKEVATAAYEAGHYIEYDKPGLMPREKYRPSLKLYRRALELDPSHEKAAFEAKQIEDIYKQMGMPVP
jgi:hypothetical protein